jgi:putative SOS response-associated peptidase YedK
MCGRFDLTVPLVRVAETFQAELTTTSLGGPRYNIAPTQETALIVGETHRQLVAGRFGLRPDWWSAPTDLINVRAESLAEKPYFAKLAASRRCLVPATGFFEWRHEGRKKTPFHFVPRAGGLLAMAGLYLVSDFGFRKSYSFAVLTCPASAAVADVHDRMPVFLNEEGIDAWLSGSSDPMALRNFLVSAPEEYLRFYQVSSLVNDPKHDGVEIAAPVA